MGTLRGIEPDGSAFARRVTKRTTRLMIREPLVEASLDALADAPDLEVFEIGGPDHLVRLASLEPLADHEKLEEVSLHVAEPPDLRPLTSCPSLHAIGLSVGGAASIDLGPLSEIRRLDSLSIRGTDQTTLDLAPLAMLPGLRSLSISGGEWRTLDLSPLAEQPLEHLSVDDGHLTELELWHVAGPTLRGLSLVDQELEHLDVHALRVCECLESLNLARNEMASLDLTGVAGIRTLTRVGWPNVKHIWIDDEVEIVAPALKHLREG